MEKKRAIGTAVVCAFLFLSSASAADGVKSLAYLDDDPDGDILSQKVSTTTEDNGDGIITKTITIVRKIKATDKKTTADEATLYAPPAEEAVDAKRIIRYFCRCWKNEDYKRMYYAMSPNFRNGMTYEKFLARFEKDAGRTRGLADENFTGEEERKGGDYQLQLTLSFNNERVKPRNIKVLATRTPNGFRLVNSPIIPVDFSDL